MPAEPAPSQNAIGESGPVDGVHWLIRSKLAPPFRGDAVIDRPRLADELLGNVPKRVTLITAPPGYGKTTLATQWTERLRSRGVTVAWLGLDEDDDEPSTLLAYLAAALEVSDVAAGTLAQAIQRGQYGLSSKPALGALLHALERCGDQVLVVLEDVHRIRSAQVLTMLDNLIERMPANTRLCLTSRTRPGLRLAGLRAQGNLTIIDADDLRFTLAEAQNYLGSGLAADTVRRIQQDSEGWPVALQLARLHLSSGASMPSAAQFVGSSSELAEYLAEQVLSTLPGDLRDTLLRISVLERVTAQLIDHLTGRSDGAGLLDRLRDGNLFLTPIDLEHGWYKFHPLFAHFLRERLARADRDAPAALHRASAVWFFEHALLQDAVRHAQASGDAALISEILERSGGWRIALRGGPMLARVFRDLQPDIVARSPRLRIGQIFWMIHDTRVADAERAFSQLVETSGGLDSEALRAVRADLLFIQLLLRAHASAPMRPEEAAALEHTVAAIEPDDPATRAIVDEMTAMAQYWAGDFDRAYDLAIAGVRACRRADMPWVEIYCHAVAGMSRWEAGALGEAEGCFAESQALATRLCGGDLQRMTAPQIFLAALGHEQGRQPGFSVAAALDAIEEGESWLELFRTAYALAIATAAEAETGILLRRAERLAGRPGLTHLDAFAAAAALRRAAADGRTAQVRELLSLACLRETPPAPDAVDWRIDSECAGARIDAGLLLGDLQAAGALLEAQVVAAGARGQNRLSVRLLVQRAVLETVAGNDAAADRALLAAVTAAAPGQILRPFLDHAAAVRGLAARLRPFTVSAALEAFRQQLQQALRPRMEDQAEADPGLRLSPREQEVLRLIAEGQTSKEAARQLGVSVNTVMTHRKNLYRKLDASTRARVIAAARAVGLIA